MDTGTLPFGRARGVRLFALMIEVLQIMPRVPPAICGIGDYSLRLARELSANHDIRSSFLCAGTNATIPEGGTEYPTAKLPALTARALVQHVRQRETPYQAIVLHVSLYGYQKRAIPFWLSRAVSMLSQKPDSPPLVAMFHELYASGSMKTSAFWLQPFQKMILRRLVRGADALRTNREAYAAWINQVSGRRAPTTTIMPVFSNFGELAIPPKLADRPPSMVMFASGIHGGMNAFQSHIAATELCRKFQLSSLHIIGGPPPRSEFMEGVRLIYQKHLPGDHASPLLTSCRMAYNAYHPEYLGKSTILAAFASHGLAVITHGEQPNLSDGLQENREVLHQHSLEHGQIPAWKELQVIADHLHAWYAPHSLANNAASYAKDILSLIKLEH